MTGFRYHSDNHCPACGRPVAAGSGNDPHDGFHFWCTRKTPAEVVAMTSFQRDSHNRRFPRDEMAEFMSAHGHEAVPGSDVGYGPRVRND